MLAVIMLHQHKFCVYKGNRKLKLPIICENFVLFALYQFLFYFGGRAEGVERVDRVIVNTTFFRLMQSVQRIACTKNAFKLNFNFM